MLICLSGWFCVFFLFSKQVKTAGMLSELVLPVLIKQNALCIQWLYIYFEFADKLWLLLIKETGLPYWMAGLSLSLCKHFNGYFILIYRCSYKNTLFCIVWFYFSLRMQHTTIVCYKRCVKWWTLYRFWTNNRRWINLQQL